jgi:hypothetical protein
VLAASALDGRMGVGEDTACCVGGVSSESLMTGVAMDVQPPIQNMQAIHNKTQRERCFLVIKSAPCRTIDMGQFLVYEIILQLR